MDRSRGISAIIEPEGAAWHVSPTMWKSVSVAANSEDRNVILRRDYPRVPGEEPLVESIELHLSDLPAIEAALLNARLWLERATKQADELTTQSGGLVMFADDDHTATVDAARAHALHYADDDHLADYDLLVTEIKADIEQERKEQERQARARRRWGR